MPSDIRTVSQRYDDLAVYFSEDLEKKGVFDENGNTVIAPEYPALTIIDRNHFLVINQDKTEWQVIDKEADVVNAFPGAIHIEDLGRFGLGVVDENNEVTIVDSKYFLPVDAGTIFSDFDNGKPQTLRMTSQYFDWEAFAEDITDGINSSGIGKYKIRGWASDMFDNTSFLEKTQVVHLNEYKISRRKYNTEVFATFASDASTFVVAMFIGEYDYQLRLLTIYFDTQQPTNLQTATALQNALHKAGFTQTDVTNANASQYAAIYKSNNGPLGAYVEFEPGASSGSVTLYSVEYNSDYTENLRNTISKYNSR